MHRYLYVGLQGNTLEKMEKRMRIFHTWSLHVALQPCFGISARAWLLKPGKCKISELWSQPWLNSVLWSLCRPNVFCPLWHISEPRMKEEGGHKAPLQADHLFSFLGNDTEWIHLSPETRVQAFVPRLGHSCRGDLSGEDTDSCCSLRPPDEAQEKQMLLVKEEGSLSSRKAPLRAVVWIIHPERALKTLFSGMGSKDCHGLDKKNVNISNPNLLVLVSC